MLERNHSNLSGFKHNLLTLSTSSEDRPDEVFLFSGEDLPDDLMPIFEGAKFLERLFRRNVPFIIVAIHNSELDYHLMYRGIFQPHLDRWEDVLEHEGARFTVLNQMALDTLPFSPHIDVLTSEQIRQWHDTFNLQLFIATLANENQA